MYTVYDIRYVCIHEQGPLSCALCARQIFAGHQEKGIIRRDPDGMASCIRCICGTSACSISMQAVYEVFSALWLRILPTIKTLAFDL